MKPRIRPFTDTRALPSSSICFVLLIPSTLVSAPLPRLFHFYPINAHDALSRMTNSISQKVFKLRVEKPATRTVYIDNLYGRTLHSMKTYFIVAVVNVFHAALSLPFLFASYMWVTICMLL